MAETIIDHLEIVDVDHQERKRSPVPAGSIPFAVSKGEEVTTVIDAGHPVDSRELLHSGTSAASIAGAPNSPP
jgi:hypothetical protein